jgi:hypothetical protein
MQNWTEGRFNSIVALDYPCAFDKRISVYATGDHTMYTTIVFNALSLNLIGFLIIVLLAVALIALHSEYRYGQSVMGVGPLVIAVIGMCTVVALMAGSMRARTLVEPDQISQRLQIVEFHESERARRWGIKSRRMKPTEVHELEQQMDALAREYAETHDQKIIAAMKGRQRKGKSFVDSCSA